MQIVFVAFCIALVLVTTVPDHYDRTDAILCFLKLWFYFSVLITFGMLVFGY